MASASERSEGQIDAQLELLLDAEVFAPQPLGRCNLLVGGGRILWMGEEEPVLPEELGATVTDLGGARLVPGFVDAHAHVTGGGGEAGYASAVPAVGLSRFTLAGVTSVVGLLGTDDCVRTTAQLLAATQALVEQGLSAWCWTGGYHLPPTTLTGSVRGDIVHLERVIGFGELAISDHRSSQPTLDEVLRLAAECHVAGLMTGKAGVLHLHVGDGARGLELVREALAVSELPPRTFHPTHTNRRRELFDEALDLAGSGVTIDVTAYPTGEKDEGWSASEAVARFLEADADPARITVSSDAGGCLPKFGPDGRVAQFGVGAPAALGVALAELLAQGWPLEHVLPAFTSNVADLLRLRGKGRIAVGADADLVVLDDEHRVRHVLALGRWHVRDGKALVRGRFE